MKRVFDRCLQYLRISMILKTQRVVKMCLPCAFLHSLMQQTFFQDYKVIHICASLDITCRRISLFDFQVNCLDQLSRSQKTISFYLTLSQ